MRPKKTRVTKELIEMTRGGLINMINLPIVDHEVGIYGKEYPRSFMKMDEEENYVTTKKNITNKIFQAKISKRRVRYYKKKEGYQEQWLSLIHI